MYQAVKKEIPNYITSDRLERFKSSEKAGNGRSGFICLRQDASGSEV